MNHQPTLCYWAIPGSMFVSACSDSVIATVPDDVSSVDTPSSQLDTSVADGSFDASESTAIDRSAPTDAVDESLLPEPPAVCAGVTCARGEACCFMTGHCFNPVSNPGDCVVPPTMTGPGVCASNRDCADGEFCRADRGSGCVGPGHCVGRESCGFCSGPAEDCSVCGCDGISYPSVQLACQAGVRTVNAIGACGATRPPPVDASVGPVRIPCALSTQCPTGQQCCPNTGVCFDPACPECCRTPPPGTDFPCTTNADCGPRAWCRGGSCGEPGGCVVRRGTGECPGAVQQVCGCDGQTYINECWANGAGTRVASQGACSMH